MQTRRADFNDLLEMQHCNLRCLPENYNLRYYLYHFLSWPELLHVTHDYDNKVCGYVLAKLDDEEEEEKVHGHVTSLAVLRTQRKLGIASKVMNQSLEQMENMTDSSYCSLHVRRTNEAALHLYQNTLGYRCWEVDEGYYVDGEDAFHMKKFLGGRPQQGSFVNPDGTLTKIEVPEGALEKFVSRKQKKALEEAAAAAAAATASAAAASAKTAAAAAAASSSNAAAASAAAAAPKAAKQTKPADKKLSAEEAKKAAAAAAAAAAAIEEELKASSKGGNKGAKKGKK